MIGNILGNVVGFLLMLGVPLASCIYYLWKRDGRIWMFFAGILSFTVSQLLIRIPLLQYAGKKWEWLMLLPYTSLVLYYGFLGLTAGLFEETGRWAAFSLMKRRRRALDWKDALALGLGHGGVEAVWVAVSGLMAGNFDFTAAGGRTLLGGVERLFAMTLHVGFSFLIFKGVEEKKARWWLLAVLLHGLTDFQLVIEIWLSWRDSWPSKLWQYYYWLSGLSGERRDHDEKEIWLEIISSGSADGPSGCGLQQEQQASRWLYGGRREDPGGSRYQAGRIQ